MTETPMTVNEAFDLISQIRRRCPDLNVKVVTTDDIYSALGFSEVDYEPEVEEALRERIRCSWEMQNFPYFGDDDWEFFYMMDGLDETLAQFNLTRD